MRGQTAPDQSPHIDVHAGEHWYDRLAVPYRAPSVARVPMENSPRIDSLLRAGRLYLSLSDAIALALENNLDLEIQRFGPRIAGTETQRAKGGGTLRGVNTSVAEIPPGVGGPASPLVTAPATGTIPGSTVSGNLLESNAFVPAQTGISITGSTPLSPGPAAPLFDPALTGQLGWQHQTTPETNTFVSGTPSLISNGTTGTLGVVKGFSTGTLISTNFNALRQNTNSTRNLYNPYTNSSLGITLTQPLLRGFSPSVNRRFIRIAKNNERVSDLVFRQQAIATVAGVIRIYWDLASLLEDVKVKQQTLALAQRLYEDNRLQVEQGTLAPIELTRAEAQVAAARQDLSNSEGFELQQELLVKTVLTRRGTADAAVRAARVVPTDPIDIPVQEPVRPVEDMVAEAFRNRPEMEEARLQIANSNIGLEGSRNELLPQLDLVGTAQNAGLAGQVNPLAGAAPAAGPGGLTPTPDGAFIGGLGTGLEQIFRRAYPTYSIGVQLNLPLRNRIAQADVARDEMQVRQSEVRLRQLEKQVRLEVESAIIAVERARAAYEAAAQTRQLQEQSLNLEMEKYQAGLSTNFLVLQYQGFAAQARSTEVAARGVYVKARTALERATGLTLQNHDVSVDEAYRGRLARPPAALPALP